MCLQLEETKKKERKEEEKKEEEGEREKKKAVRGTWRPDVPADVERSLWVAL